jgi:phosphoglucomutase
VTEKAEKWLTPAYDAETQAEVKRMLENEDKTELIEAFYKDLEFGTGGLRGIMGVGTNRMNIYTVGAATQGLSNYLNANFKDMKQISVVVGYDCRNNSSLFAKISADIFSANGIKVYLFEEMRPTPEMSFAIRHLGCQSGIILTASHNPKEYNGYKAYWDDGAQVLAPHDKGIIDEVNKIASAADIKFQGNPDLIQIIGEDVDKIYLDMVKTVSIDPEAIARHKDMKIVYTPIHGTGMMLIPRALKMWGFENVYTVPEQMIKDGNFPTVVSPNPENAEALTMALNLAKEIDADLVMASDPDADRVGIACKNDKGEWVLINGNQTCLMYLYYIITQYNKLGKMTGNEFCVKTIVTTELIKKIADKNHIEMLDCYTGFKWIAREIRLREGKKKYIGGGEESYGFLAEDFVRDKDAVSACCLIAEVAAWAKDNGKTLYQLLMDIYVEYGFSTVNVVKPGKSGAEEIKAMMENFRANPPKELGGSKVVLSKDYKTLKQTDAAGHVTDIDMPESSNVLQYFTEDGGKVSVRPSGTEPKIKFYIEVKGEMGCRNCFATADAEATEKVEAVKKSLGI